MAKDIHFSVRFTVSMVKDLDWVAKESRRNRNQVIELCVEGWLPRMIAELKGSKSSRKYVP